MANNGAATVLSPEPETKGDVRHWPGVTPAARKTTEAHTFMARLDQKAGERVELSRGTIWLMATLIALAGVAGTYGISLVGWVRNDESQRAKLAEMQKDVEETRNDIKELKNQFNELQKTLQALALKDAEKRGYELKAAEGDHGKR